MRLGSGPTQSHLVTNSEVSLEWGEGFWQFQPLAFVLVISSGLSSLTVQTGAQRGTGACPRAHSKLIKEWRLSPGLLPDSSALALA